MKQHFETMSNAITSLARFRGCVAWVLGGDAFILLYST